jgi:hypothetical protein
LAEQIAFYNRRLAAGDNGAAWALLALKVGERPGQSEIVGR